MKILALSDSHGDEASLHEVIKKHRSADLVVFCGDGCSDINRMRTIFHNIPFLCVKGNCDWYCDFPFIQNIELGGKEILVTHGHMFGVKEGYSRIINLGRENNADIVIFGHTHKQFTSVEGRMLLVNPGSIGYRGNYTIIEINETTGKIKATEYPDDDYGPVIL